MISINDYSELFNLSKKDFENYRSLPMSAYITAIDGVIIHCNQEALNLFEITEEVIGKSNILEFYRYKEERDLIIQKLERLSPDEWIKDQTLEYFINNKKQCLRFFAKPYFSPNDSKLLGCLCISSEIKELERFREMESLLSVGIFEIVDEAGEGKITYFNPTFKKLLGIPDSQKVQNVSHFLSQQDITSIIKELRHNIVANTDAPENTVVKKERLKIKKFDGSTLIVNIDLIPEIFQDGKIKKLKGIVEDFTSKNILEEVPIGLYLVKHDGEKDIIISANEHFAQILNLPSAKSCEGMDISSFHSNIKEKEQFKQKLLEAHEEGKLLKDYYLKIKTFNGDERTLSVTAKLIKDNGGKIFGRAGAIYDITEEIEMAFISKRDDYARFLHKYGSMLDTIQLTVNAIIGAHGTTLLEEKNTIDIDKAKIELHQALNTFIKSLNKLIAELQKNNDIEDKTVESINNYVNRVWDKKNHLPFQEASWVRANLKFIKQLLPQSIKYIKIRNEPFKQYQKDMSEVFRYSRLISLRLISIEVKEMHTELKRFNRALSQPSVDVGITATDLVSVLSNSISSLSEYSTTRNIKVILKNYTKDTKYVLANESDLHTAFYNVIHNAIKYSWQKRKEADAWITATVSEVNEYLQVTIENWGVAIREEEIKSGAIWYFSYRGDVSNDRERPGSGIGLDQTRKIILLFKGEIDITSVQVTFKEKDPYKNAFLTTLIIKLPIIKNKQ